MNARSPDIVAYKWLFTVTSVAICIEYEKLATEKENVESKANWPIEREGNRVVAFRKRRPSKGGTGNRARPTPGSITGKYIRGWKAACAGGMLNFTVIDRHLPSRSMRPALLSA